MLLPAVGERGLRLHVFVAPLAKRRAAPVGGPKALDVLLIQAHEVQFHESPVLARGNLWGQLLEPACTHWLLASSCRPGMPFLDTVPLQSRRVAAGSGRGAPYPETPQLCERGFCVARDIPRLLTPQQSCNHKEFQWYHVTGSSLLPVAWRKLAGCSQGSCKL